MKSGFLPWLIWALAALFVVFNYLQQVVPDVIGTDLTQALKVDDSTLGNIAASYFYAYAILQIPVGMILDYHGAHRPLVLAMTVAGLATLGFALAHDAGSAWIARLLMGASSAFSFIGCLKLVEEWFPHSRFSTLAGMTNTAGMLGAASGAPFALLVNWAGWRGALCWIGAVELAIAALVFLVVRDRESPPRKSNDGHHATTQPFACIFRLIQNSQVWLNAIYATSISLVFVAFGGLWGEDYIQKTYRLTAEAAADVGSLLFLGGIAGSIFFGWWSDFLRRRKLPMIAAGLGALLTMGCLLYVPGLPLIWFRAGLFAVGFFSSANIVSYAVARDLFSGLAGLSIGFLSTCYYAGSATSQPLVGLLLQSASPGSLTTASYQYALSPLVICMGIALIASLLIKETLPGTPAKAPQ